MYLYLVWKISVLREYWGFHESGLGFLFVSGFFVLPMWFESLFTFFLSFLVSGDCYQQHRFTRLSGFFFCEGQIYPL